MEIKNVSGREIQTTLEQPDNTSDKIREILDNSEGFEENLRIARKLIDQGIKSLSPYEIDTYFTDHRGHLRLNCGWPVVELHPNRTLLVILCMKGFSGSQLSNTHVTLFCAEYHQRYQRDPQEFFTFDLRAPCYLGKNYYEPK